MMLKNTFKAFAFIIATVFTVNLGLANTPVDSHANAHETEHHAEKEKVDVTEMIMHHIKDAHEWHLWGGHENGVSVYLPIILIDGGLKVFSSSNFYHGEHVGHGEESYLKGTGAAQGYAMFHEKIYKLDARGNLNFNEEHHINRELNSKLLDFSITKNVLALIVSAFLLILILTGVAKSYKKHGFGAPKGMSRFIEPIVLFIRDDIARDNIGEKKYKKFMPYLLTAFFFIWINNLLGLVPIIPGGANLTGNISFTLIMASFTLILTLISANKHYWRHIFATPGVPKALLPIMIPVEIIGIFTKPFALMVRLFANITAGHIIILSLVGIIFTFQSAAWGALSVPMALFISVLELLVAFLQAFIFTMLSALFIGAAVAEHH